MPGGPHRAIRKYDGIRRNSGQDELSGDDELKVYALNSLMANDSPRAVELLRQFLAGNHPRKLQEQALFVLSQSEDPAARQLLVEIAQGQKQPELREKAIEMLGIAGGPEKCAYVKDVLGFDACFDYKAGKLRDELKDIDVYFDNVGGEILDTALARMKLAGRVVVCGTISDYNASDPYRVRNWRAILVNRLKVQGMIVFDWKERYGEALKALAGYLQEGKLKTRESVVEGLANAPQGFIALLKGGNFGKQLVKLA